MARCYQTLPEVEGVAERGLQAYNMLAAGLDLETDNLVDRVISELNAVIEAFKGQQDQFLNMFDCSSTEEFEARVRDYYNYDNLTKFTGSQLRAIVNDFKTAQDERIQQIRELLTLMLDNIKSNSSLKDSLEEEAKRLYGAELSKHAPTYFMQLISAGLSGVQFGGGILGGQGGLQGTQALKGTGKFDSSGQEILEVSAASVTTAFNRHLKKMEEMYWANINKNTNNLPKSVQRTKQLLNGFTTTNVNSNKAEITLGVMWSQELNSLMDRMAKNKNNPDLIDDELMEFNRKIKNKILDTLNLPDDRIREFAKRRIEEMIAADKTIFLIGNSPTQLEGVLGEINAVIAISRLLGKNFMPKIISWIGSQKVGHYKRQPSVDIVLSDIAGIKYGVQVKNTMTDLDEVDIAHEIGFANKSIEQTFNQLGFGAEVSNAVEDVYVANTYNVPYKKEGKYTYVQVGYNTPFVHNDSTAPLFHQYTKTDELIDEIVANMNMFLTMYAPDFLYMGLGNTFKSKLATLSNKLKSLRGVGGNYVYIVGPKVYFAHDMLSKLVEQLEALKNLEAQEEQMSFKLEAYFGKLEGEKESFNIVSDLNNFGGKGGSKHTIKMRSSWLFT